MQRRIALALGLLLIGLTVAGPVAGSAGPTPFCPVCGETLHENVTGSTATLTVQSDRDIRWHVENEVAEPTASTWRNHSSQARVLVLDALVKSHAQLQNPSGVETELRGDTLTISFVDRRGARSHFGVFVVPYLHGEGVEARYVINADRLAVAGPEGSRVLNDPAGATVGDRTATWNGSATDARRAAPEPGDTYVVFGNGPGGELGAVLATTLLPLDPGRYAFYALGLLLSGGLAVAVGSTSRREYGRRGLAVGGALAAVPYVVYVLSVHPIPPGGTLPGVAARMFVGLVALLVGIGAGLGFHVRARMAEPSN